MLEVKGHVSIVTSSKGGVFCEIFVDAMSVPSFFGNLFGELIPGGDCSSIEQDPHADPFDRRASHTALASERHCVIPFPCREVCQQFRRFNDAFGRSLDVEHRSPEEGRPAGVDYESL